MSDKSITDIRGAVARGWCHRENASKEMDATLAESIAQEVASMLCGGTPQSPAADEPAAWIYEERYGHNDEAWIERIERSLPVWEHRNDVALYLRPQPATPQPPSVSDEDVQTLRDMLACCESWEPTTRILGNVCAGDAAEAITAALESFAERIGGERG